MCFLCSLGFNQNHDNIVASVTGEIQLQFIAHSIDSAADIVEGADASADIGTAYSVSVGQTIRGALSGSGDHDWYRVTLTAGQTYTAMVVGNGVDDVNDTYLSLRDASGALIGSDDDSAPNYASTGTFTASYSGAYYIDVSAYTTSDTGQYGVSVTLGGRADIDISMAAGIIDAGSWSSTRGTGTMVSVGFRATDDGLETNFSQFSAAQQTATLLALQYFDDVSGLEFNIVNQGAHTDNATILLSNYNNNDGSGGYAYYPGSAAADSQSGNIHINLAGGSSNSSLPLGSYSFFTILHELGHAVGLSHPGLYNAGSGQSITYANNAQFLQDSHQYTVMSYFDESYTTTSWGAGRYPQTLMMADILALQNIYGADYAARSGNTTYGYNATETGVYNFASNATPALCIWDGAGTDTIDVSGYSGDQTIRLPAGTFSSVLGLTNNVSIAIGVVIENAIGGSGNDILIGNSANNVLNGGGGTDIAVYTGNRGAYQVLSCNGTIAVLGNGEGSDRLYSIESLQFADGTLASDTTSTAFSPYDYIATYSDLIQAFGANEKAAFDHYVEWGFNEGRVRDGFDGVQYLAAYNDLIQAFGANETAAAQHFVANGFSEGRVRDSFDSFQYLASHSDLIQAFGANETAAARHFVEWGFNEARTRDTFNAPQYLANYADLQAAFGNDEAAATSHFINYGHFEGRTDDILIV